jgi:hypothetical protein
MTQETMTEVPVNPYPDPPRRTHLMVDIANIRLGGLPSRSNPNGAQWAPSRTCG